MTRKITIKLSNKFYKKESIEDAIGAFNKVCECTILDDSFLVEITPKIEPEDYIELEFANFVLGVTKEKMLF